MRPFNKKTEETVRSSEDERLYKNTQKILDLIKGQELKETFEDGFRRWYTLNDTISVNDYGNIMFNGISICSEVHAKVILVEVERIIIRQRRAEQKREDEERKNKLRDMGFLV
jgi:hypothetical protein